MKRNNLLIIFTILIVFTLSYSASINIHLSDPVYFFVEKIVIKKQISFNTLYTRPWKRNQVAKFLCKVDSINNKTVLLSKVEKEQLEYYISEFSGEDALRQRNIEYSEKHILHYISDSLKKDKKILDVKIGIIDSFHYFPNLNIDTNRIEGFYSNAMGVNGKIRGKLGDNIAFSGNMRVYTEVSNDTTAFGPSGYEPFLNNYPFEMPWRDSGEASDGKKTWDILGSGLFVSTKFVNLEFGLNSMRFGPAEKSPVTMSGILPPFASIKASMDIWKLHYLQTLSFLKGQKDADKYMFAHRIEATLPKGFYVGVTEVSIYGDSAYKEPGDPSRNRDNDRGLEYSYMLPFVTYFFLEHYDGDRNNTALSFDVAWVGVRNLKLYLELFLDDLIEPLSMFGPHWRNKWASTLGAKYFLPFKTNDISILLEYSRVQPWVYTHFLGESHRYTHFGTSIGSQIGPNADEIYLALEFRPIEKLSFILDYSNLREGINSKGISVYDTHIDYVDSEESEFLAEYKSNFYVGLKTNYRINRLFFADFSYNYGKANKVNYSEISSSINFLW